MDALIPQFFDGLSESEKVEWDVLVGSGVDMERARHLLAAGRDTNTIGFAGEHRATIRELDQRHIYASFFEFTPDEHLIEEEVERAREVAQGGVGPVHLIPPKVRYDHSADEETSDGRDPRRIEEREAALAAFERAMDEVLEVDAPGIAAALAAVGVDDVTDVASIKGPAECAEDTTREGLLAILATSAEFLLRAVPHAERRTVEAKRLRAWDRALYDDVYKHVDDLLEAAVKPRAFMPAIRCIARLESTPIGRPELEIPWQSALTIVWFQDSVAMPMAPEVAAVVATLSWEELARDYEY